MNLYDYFVDEMEEGHFKSFRHEHFFREKNGLTVMKDKLYYEVLLGYLEKYLITYF